MLTFPEPKKTLAQKAKTPGQKKRLDRVETGKPAARAETQKPGQKNNNRAKKYIPGLPKDLEQKERHRGRKHAAGTSNT